MRFQAHSRDWLNRTGFKAPLSEATLSLRKRLLLAFPSCSKCFSSGGAENFFAPIVDMDFELWHIDFGRMTRLISLCFSHTQRSRHTQPLQSEPPCRWQREGLPVFHTYFFPSCWVALRADPTAAFVSYRCV
jgi:hypothetical protein